ncbi:MAG: hypothetical protein AAGB15_12140, partial [Pseudomonadota bacterium]
PRFGTAQVYQMYRFIFERSSRLPLRHRARAMRSRAAIGHIPFGYFDLLYPDALYVSLFRAPEARFLSFVNFMLATPDHKSRQRLDPGVLDRAAEDPDAVVRAVLEDEHLALIHANTQTRLAAGAARLGPHPVTGAHLQIALMNLGDPRYLVGLQEDFDAFVLRLDGLLPGDGVAPAVPPRLAKKGHARIGLAHLSPKSRARIRSANALDLALIDAIEETAVRQAQAA